MMKTVIVQTTVSDEEEADGLESAVLEARLAACVHRVAVKSRYWWNGRVETGSETLLVFKTAEVQAERLVAFIRVRHSNVVPEILVLPVIGGDPAYLRWVSEETVSKRDATVEELGE